MKLEDLTKEQLVAEIEILRQRLSELEAINVEFIQNKKALQECKQHNKLLSDIIPQGIIHTSIEGDCNFVSERWLKITGLSIEEALGKGWLRTIHPEDKARVMEEWYRNTHNNQLFKSEYRLKKNNGDIALVIGKSMPEQSADGEIVSCIGTLEDISERYQAEEELRKRNEFIDTVLDSLPIGLAVNKHDDGNIMYMNDKFADIYGWKRENLINQDNFYECIFPDKTIREEMKIKMIEDINSGDPAKMRWENMTTITEGGEKRVLMAQKIPLLKQNLVISTVQDVTEYKRTEDLFKHLAAHDLLTDLPNRTLFLDRLNYSLARARRGHQQMAIILLDLDNFKAINDVFSHKTGDVVLLTVTERLIGCLRESDTVARMGGDEFGVLIDGITNIMDVNAIAQKILCAISKPIIVDGDEIFATSSIGISLFPNHGDTHQALLQNADIALHVAKGEGKNCYQFFTVEMAVKTIDRMLLGKQLHHALERNEFILHYQPQVNTKTGGLLGIEALLRWQHPEQGLILPARFLSLAEESGAIIPIGEWVLHNACQQNKAWQDMGLPPMRMAVNLSARQLRQSQLVEVIKRILDETRLNPDFLELEFTENIVFQNTSETIHMLQDLKTLGVHLAIDDFGTGYTSLSYLTRFPFDTIKIDLSFAKKITTYPSDAAIVAGVIAIANSLQMSTIVEGVETQEQLKFFQEQGCNQVQGWYFSPAVPASDIERLCHENFTCV